MVQRLARLPTLLLLAMIPGVTVLVMSAAHATHEDEGNSRYFWDRSTAGGHRDLLMCERPPNGDQCVIPFEINHNVASIRLSLATIKSEAAGAVNTINSVTDYIGVKPITSSDNEIRGKYIAMMHAAQYKINRHCTAWLGICIGDHGKDDHIVDFKIFLNTNRNVAVFGTEEQCNNRNTLVTRYDVGKTILHELWHILGTEHSGERTSVVYYYGDTCGQADTPDDHDREVLMAKYPRGVR